MGKTHVASSQPKVKFYYGLRQKPAVCVKQRILCTLKGLNTVTNLRSQGSGQLHPCCSHKHTSPLVRSADQLFLGTGEAREEEGAKGEGERERAGLSEHSLVVSITVRAVFRKIAPPSAPTSLLLSSSPSPFPIFLFVTVFPLFHSSKREEERR